MALMVPNGTGITGTTEFDKGIVAQAGLQKDAKVLYLDRTDNKWKLADATSAIKAGRDGLRIQLTQTEADGDTAMMAVSGEMNIAASAALVPGTSYYVSATAGSMCEESDLVGGNFKTLVGITGAEGATSTDLSEFVLQPVASGKTV